MAPSIRNRLLHPAIALRQGLPTSRRSGDFKEAVSRQDLSEETLERLEAYLRAIPGVDQHSSAVARKDYLYTNLSIIDSKAQALLSFNSFLLAIIGIYFGTVQSIRDEVYLLIPFLMTVVASGVSCLLCLDVVWVHWLSADDLAGDEEDDDAIGHGFIELLLLRDERTRTYRTAWMLSFISVGAVVFGVVVAVSFDAVAG